jgi:hypothetical protein
MKMVYVVSRFQERWLLRAQRGEEVMSQEQQQPDLVAELKAIGRQGLKDLQNVVLHAFPDSMQLHSESGTPLNPTPQMITHDLGALEGYQPHLDAYIGQDQEVQSAVEAQPHLEGYLGHDGPEQEPGKEMER